LPLALVQLTNRVGLLSEYRHHTLQADLSVLIRSVPIWISPGLPTIQVLSLLSRCEVSKRRADCHFTSIRRKPAESDRYSLPACKASAKPLQALKYVVKSTAPNYDRQRGVLFHPQHLSNLISV
jgi:hypothetical protein